MTEFLSPLFLFYSPCPSTAFSLVSCAEPSHDGTVTTIDSMSVQMRSQAFLRHSQPPWYTWDNSIFWSGIDRWRWETVSLLSLLCILSWCKLATAPLNSGQLQELYFTWWSAPHLCNSLYGHTGTFSQQQCWANKLVTDRRVMTLVIQSLF